MENNESPDQQNPPLFDNVDITSPDNDENENDIFESAIQVQKIRLYRKTRQID